MGHRCDEFADINDPFLSLGAAIFWQAQKDLRSGGQIAAIDAFAWLLGYGRQWLDVLGASMPEIDYLVRLFDLPELLE